jgi:hypothetical protein
LKTPPFVGGVFVFQMTLLVFQTETPMSGCRAFRQTISSTAEAPWNFLRVRKTELFLPNSGQSRELAVLNKHLAGSSKTLASIAHSKQPLRSCIAAGDFLQHERKNGHSLSRCLMRDHSAVRNFTFIAAFGISTNRNCFGV